MLGKPALLVPSPNVTGHQQEKNAALVGSLGGAKVLLEGQFDASGLFEETERLLRDRTALVAMGEAMRATGKSDATERIADLILDFVK